MQSYIFFAYALVAITSARQLKAGPQTWAEDQSSMSSQNQAKRYITQEYTLYLTPSEIKALQDAKSSAGLESLQSSQKSEESDQQNDKEQKQESNGQYFLPKEPQAEIRGLVAHDGFYQNKNAENQLQNYQFVNFNWEPKSEQQPKQTVDVKKNEAYESFNWQKEQEAINQQKSEEIGESNWKPYNPVSARNQEELLLHEQLKQQWNDILDHNRLQLKALSSAPKNKEDSQKLYQNEKSAQPSQEESKKEEEKKSEIEKQIEDIIRSQQNFDLAKQNAIAQAEAKKQIPPILIHKEVSVTRHLPVPVVKQVKVPVHTPVLVPVPEPYEVKVLHPYPVPLHIVKHIPVPVIKHH